MSTSAGRRPGVPGVVVIIADRKSEDDTRRAAKALRDSGELFFSTFLNNVNLLLTLGKLASWQAGQHAGAGDGYFSDLAHPGPGTCSIIL